jgi:hypothetical protein
MEFHLFEIPLREAENGRGEPKLMLYLVGRGRKSSNLPISQFCSQLNEVLEQHGLGHVKVTTSDIIFALRSGHWRSLERKRRPEK